MLTALDRLISVFSPERGVRRAAARSMLSQFRDYASAGTGRRNKGWNGRATSANVEVGAAQVILRNRAREFVRNSWAGQRILDVLTAHVVGTGIMVVPDTGSDRYDNKYRAAWDEWQAVADVEGVLDFNALQALAVRSMVEGGDSLIRFIDTDYDGKVVPFRLHGLEGDLIDSSKDRALGGEKVRQGIKLGEFDRRQGVYLFQKHPAEENVAFGFRDSNLVAWDDISFLHRPLRFGQVRGITWFAPILLTGREMQDLTEAAIVKERTQASFAGFLKRPPGGASPFATKDGDDPSQKVTRIEPGMIADIGDADIAFAQPSGQSSFAEAYVAGMQAIAAGAGLTYDQLTGDLRRANYSSLRAGKIEFRRLVEQIQWHIVGPRLCLPVSRRFADRAMLAGALPKRREGYRVKLIMPANEPIDPKKDLEADILAVRSGRMSPQEFISAWGRDWREVVKDFEAFFKSTDFTFDIDPRKPANGAGGAAPERNNPDD